VSLSTRPRRAHPPLAGRRRCSRASATLRHVSSPSAAKNRLAGTSIAGLDEESREWLRCLRADGPVKEAAVARLHALLVRAARFEVGRRRPTLPHLRGDELEDIATEAADDALVSVLRRLDDFRGASRFSTWVYKFALLEAGVRVRRRAWQNREVVLDSDSWSAFADAAEQPDAVAERSELLSAIGECIAGELTPHQRQVLVALAIDGVPIDVLAERLTTTRGALYKTLHDARRRLRGRLAERGLSREVS
jgi:RNA polymerase sigma-70 factor, ECF subfamily